MSITIHMASNIEADGTDRILELLHQLVDEGHDIDELVLAMLSCVTAITEAHYLEHGELM